QVRVTSRGPPRPRHPPSAALTSARLVTVEAFWRAKLIEAFCQPAFMVEQQSSGTTIENPLAAPVRAVCSIDMFVHAPGTITVSRPSPARGFWGLGPCPPDRRIF